MSVGARGLWPVLLQARGDGPCKGSFPTVCRDIFRLSSPYLVSYGMLHDASLCYFSIIHSALSLSPGNKPALLALARTELAEADPKDYLKVLDRVIKYVFKNRHS